MIRQVIILLFSLALLQTADAQDSAFIYDMHHYKKGVYKTFKEFRSNNPAVNGTLRIKDKTPAAQIYLFSARNELHIVDSTGQEKKVKDYWGYCDGQSIYIKDNGLNKLQEIGYYCLYQVKAITSSTGNRNTDGITFNNTPPQTASKKVLNIITGDVYDLTMYNLRKYILPRDTALLAEFNTDREGRSKMVYYIRKFNHRNEPVL